MSYKKILTLLCSFILALSISTQVQAKTFGYTNANEYIKQTQSAIAQTSDIMQKLNLQLELAVVNFIERHEKHKNATKDNPSIKSHVSGKNLYSYSEIDKSNIEIEVTQSTSKHADYFGKVRYMEIFYESLCSANDPQACQFSRINSRRVTEFARYDNGKWHY